MKNYTIDGAPAPLPNTSLLFRPRTPARRQLSLAEFTAKAQAIGRAFDAAAKRSERPKPAAARSITGFSVTAPKPLTADRQGEILQRQGKADAERIAALQARHRATRGAA